jgi:hypothetical protein
VFVLLAGTGCGSKISEANYYRVQYGMSESAVEELLGPPHRQGVEAASERGDAGTSVATSSATVAATGSATAPATAPAPDGAAERTVKTWTRGPLVITVVFESGKVVGRRGEGPVKS